MILFKHPNTQQEEFRAFFLIFACRGITNAFGMPRADCLYLCLFESKKKFIARGAQREVITIACRTIVVKLRTACCPQFFHMSAS
ncbi:hypothetical protein [Plesiomonas shigelloides]|uniref:hypothetical protein n=1 Tax=Plesiomonas shigelloides TaxID=703 RepID=UPI0013273BB5|nr:hypothetical protein [Plesiomonas shigelloides]KAB7692124.1 hypothetical protein GBN28_02840 [Plesiomonas shigelloides]